MCYGDNQSCYLDLDGTLLAPKAMRLEVDRRHSEQMGEAAKGSLVRRRPSAGCRTLLAARSGLGGISIADLRNELYAKMSRQYAGITHMFDSPGT